MNTQTIQVEAESVELARADLKTKIPAGFFIQSEEILSTGKIQTSRGMADTYTDAVSKAKANVPADSRALETKEVQKAEARTITVEAENEEAAQELVKGKIDKTDIVKSLKLTVPGKKGFWGIGKTLGQFQVMFLRQSIVEITHKKKAFIKVTVGDQITSWQALLSSLISSGASPETSSLFEQFPYHVLFGILSNKLDDPAYFNSIPFSPISPQVINLAKRYVENPRLGMLGAFGGGLDPDRYVIKPDGKVYRKANMVIDGAIVSVADCMKGRGNISLNDTAGISRFAYDAIVHYAELPAAAFFFSLPYLDTVVTSKELSIQEARATRYKGVEGLLVELYDALGEGGLISDKMVLSKVQSLL